MSDQPPESDRREHNTAMAVRRWFLIVAVPTVFFLTLASVAQWQVFWQWLVK